MDYAGDDSKTCRTMQRRIAMTQVNHTLEETIALLRQSLCRAYDAGDEETLFALSARIDKLQLLLFCPEE